MNKGFTLVEVIVVAIIILVLSAVAIPLYNGYVDGATVGTVDVYNNKEEGCPCR